MLKCSQTKIHHDFDPQLTRPDGRPDGPVCPGPRPQPGIALLTPRRPAFLPRVCPPRGVGSRVCGVYCPKAVLTRTTARQAFPERQTMQASRRGPGLARRRAMVSSQGCGVDAHNRASGLSRQAGRPHCRGDVLNLQLLQFCQTDPPCSLWGEFSLKNLRKITFLT